MWTELYLNHLNYKPNLPLSCNAVSTPQLATGTSCRGAFVWMISIVQGDAASLNNATIRSFKTGAEVQLHALA